MNDLSHVYIKTRLSSRSPLHQLSGHEPCGLSKIPTKGEETVEAPLVAAIFKYTSDSNM